MTDGPYQVNTTEASMKSILVACPMIMFALAAAAQLPSVPKLPTGDKPPLSAPSTTPPSGATVPGVGPSLPGAGQTANPVDRLKVEAECKIPTNALKPECIELRLKK